MAVTRLLLVRHGATTATEEGRFSGASGTELSEEGRRQAACLGARLAEDPGTANCGGAPAVPRSPRVAPSDTAGTIATHCGGEPILRDGLREIDHGHWESMKRADVEREFADEYAAYEADTLTFAP